MDKRKLVTDLALEKLNEGNKNSLDFRAPFGEIVSSSSDCAIRIEYDHEYGVSYLINGIYLSNFSDEVITKVFNFLQENLNRLCEKSR